MELGPAAGAQQPPPAPPSPAARREAQPQYVQGSGNQHNDGLGSQMGRKVAENPLEPHVSHSLCPIHPGTAIPSPKQAWLDAPLPRMCEDMQGTATASALLPAVAKSSPQA